VYKTSTSGTALDCNALPRFIASNFTEKRIWRKKVAVADHQFWVLLEIRHDQAVQGIDVVLTQLAVSRDFRVYFTESTGTQFLLITNQNCSSKAQQVLSRAASSAGIVQVVASLLGTSPKGDSMAMAKVQREMWQLAKEFHITASHELSVAAKQELKPINNEDTAGFTQLPWEPQGAKVYRSPDFTAFIKLVGNQKVPGLIDKYGKQLSINDVLKELETIKPRIPALYMGGFIRDLIKNKRADDIDFSFATDPEVGVIEPQLLCVSYFVTPPFLRASHTRA
jgi:hypothetical protein